MNDVITIENLKPSQKEGVIKITNFLNSNEKVFRLIGPAGSGKTTIIRFALQHFLKLDEENKGMGDTPNVLGMAVAHKAKKVLSKSIINVQTFAKAYGYKEHIDDDGVRTFVPKKDFDDDLEPPMGYMAIPVFVHDEISMYDQQMLDIILKNTHRRSKIILMGDRAQLPPIGKMYDADGRPVVDEDSPVFTMPLPEHCHHELLERVRQTEGNPILDLADIIREELDNKTYDIGRVINKILTPCVIDGKGYDIDTMDNSIQNYINGGNYLNNKIICYRNNTVEKHNVYIREAVMGYQEDKLVENDLVFLTNNFRSKKPDFTLNNADEYQVQQVSKKDMKFNDYIIESYFAFIPNSDYNFPVYIVTPTAKGEIQLKKALNELKDKAQVNRKVWTVFYRLKDSFVTYTMAFAINAYRSQGSTYDNVYFDLMDVLNNLALSPKRMLQTIYTVVTRAKYKVTFIRN